MLEARVVPVTHNSDFEQRLISNLGTYLYSAGQELQNDDPFMNYSRPETLLDRVYTGFQHSAAASFLADVTPIPPDSRDRERTADRKCGNLPPPRRGVPRGPLRDDGGGGAAAAAAFPDWDRPNRLRLVQALGFGYAPSRPRPSVTGMAKA